jgi:S-adenosylmethionine decarboxylase
MTEHFGEHFTLDGYRGSYKKLNNKELLLETLLVLPDLLDMHRLADPVVYFAPGNDERDPGGWSGFVVIEESHISIHTFPARGFVSIDVYTCKNGLDTARIQKYYQETFDLEEVETNLLIRGTKYPVENIYEQE